MRLSMARRWLLPACLLLQAWALPAGGAEIRVDNRVDSRVDISAAHRKAMLRIVDAMDLPAMMRGTAVNAPMPADTRELMQGYFRETKDEVIAQHCARAMAQQMDEKSAVAVAAIMEKPAMRQFVRAAVRAGARRERLEMPKNLTPADRKEIDRLSYTPAMVEFNQKAAKMGEQAMLALRGQLEEYQAAKVRQSGSIMVASLGEMRAAAEQGLPLRPAPAKTGLPNWDLVIDAVLGSAAKWLQADRDFEQALKRCGFDGAIPTAGLATPEALARSRQSVEEAGRLVLQYQADAEDILRRREADLQAISTSSREAFMRNVNVGLTKIMEHAIRQGELLHKLVDANRRLLALAEARAGQLRMEDGVLLFPSEEDRKLAQALYEEIAGIGRAMQSEVERVREDESQGLKRMQQFKL